ncbi:hypothetical protein Syn7502_00696 [Synechococcus sp. PCC 7502]|uniref:hypothetical protein n=1 Tax=Synechococcus sp. PCC 7502 TaxID=1173263 RepID=UPI00029FBBC5|nr:hypothetical protein [Synechococcus sp. PCC 7502]AFY72838.1 hypothetical protein Syn7502_00696 [Synechococcus sp. PCC 7502]
MTSVNPILKTALAGLELNLDQELARYKGEASLTNIHPNTVANSDFNLYLEPDSEPNTQNLDLSYLDDQQPTGLENTLDEEFQDLITTEFTDIFPRSELEDQYQQNSPEYSQESPESTFKLLSPVGIISMILLLISSATIGYLWVDPSGLNRLIKPAKDDTKSSTIQNLELFPPEAKNSSEKIEQLPFVDFAVTKSQDAQRISAQVLRPLMPLIPPTTGRSFEPPIRVEPEVKVQKKAKKVEPVVPAIAKTAPVDNLDQIELALPESRPQSSVATKPTATPITSPKLNPPVTPESKPEVIESPN